MAQVYIRLILARKLQNRMYSMDSLTQLHSSSIFSRINEEKIDCTVLHTPTYENNTVSRNTCCILLISSAKN